MLFGIKPLQQGFCQARNFEDAPIDETQKVFRRAEAQSMRARIFGCMKACITGWFLSPVTCKTYHIFISTNY